MDVSALYSAKRVGSAVQDRHGGDRRRTAAYIWLAAHHTTPPCRGWGKIIETSFLSRSVVAQALPVYHCRRHPEHSPTSSPYKKRPPLVYTVHGAGPGLGRRRCDSSVSWRAGGWPISRAEGRGAKQIPAKSKQSKGALGPGGLACCFGPLIHNADQSPLIAPHFKWETLPFCRPLHRESLGGPVKAAWGEVKRVRDWNGIGTEDTLIHQESSPPQPNINTLVVAQADCHIAPHSVCSWDRQILTLRDKYLMPPRINLCYRQDRSLTTHPDCVALDLSRVGKSPAEQVDRQSAPK
ncbi:hypothetical protein GGTG_05604 [Gaeumannomyces tritici R3-111a-1]|uniref:Uncharacterized protein n=1 Tax=Gaeumannomyces tritici (strain R3-111a-1) TaxID=644352 RepID=J3NWE0_GAET3|nr:hypothetical protein GGTG_05604 [Gaeumannomyces tritici R3-111a-1]EJT75672.1 hypothetical protein GGTG_05604 [Gaeumannomyces tritici R3-111a-1]